MPMGPWEESQDIDGVLRVGLRPLAERQLIADTVCDCDVAINRVRILALQDPAWSGLLTILF